MILLSCAAAGADDPAIERGREWWSFRPVQRPDPPKVDRTAAIQNPIDAFVRAAQDEVGLSPSPEADRLTLIRRLTFDLTGLPPSPDEVDAFLTDSAPDAYERLVDRLLASPRFGERWARPWLDLARYADSDGFEFDKKRPNAWRYRDWVVAALNDDLSFDRFIQLQLAADELAADEPEHRAALGFLRNGPLVGNQKNEKVRADELDDVVGTTSSVFLGLTVACARCHDHKFDPVPTEDYYRLAAVFAPGRFAEVPLAAPAEVERHRRATSVSDEQVDACKAEILSIERDPRERLEARKRAELPETFRRALASGTVKALSKEEQDELTRRTTIQPDELDAALGPIALASRAEWRARIERLESTRPAPLPEAPGVVESGARPRPVHVLIRGSVDAKGAEVRPGPPRAIAGRTIDFDDAPAGSPSTGRRAALARWLTDPAHPLTARVQVNRLWQGHFGLGLVATPSDFGAMGEAPLLPALLDWLAAEFVARGWSQKAIHRLIVTSATYRQTSRLRVNQREADPDGALFWRFPPRRLEAEEIRDAVLWCAGTLNERRGGPGVFPPIDPAVVRNGNVPRWPLDATEGPEVWRRSLYVFQMRSVPVPLLEVFDLPDSTQSCPRRSRTTIPTQSLSLWNNAFLLDQSRRFAGRVAVEAGSDPSARVELAYRLATGRRPDEAIGKALLVFLARQTAEHAGRDDAPDVAALADVCHVLYNTNAFLYLD